MDLPFHDQFSRSTSDPSTTHDSSHHVHLARVPCDRLPRSRSHMLPSFRSHVRISRSSPIDNLDRLLRGRGLVFLWVQTASSHCQWRIHASAFLNHWTRGTLSLSGYRSSHRQWRCSIRPINSSLPSRRRCLDACVLDLVHPVSRILPQQRVGDSRTSILTTPAFKHFFLVPFGSGSVLRA